MHVNLFTYAERGAARIDNQKAESMKCVEKVAVGLQTSRTNLLILTKILDLIT